MPTSQPIAAHINPDGTSLTWALPSHDQLDASEIDQGFIRALLHHVVTGERLHEGTVQIDRVHGRAHLRIASVITPSMVAEVTIGDQHFSIRQRRISLEGLSNFRDLGGYVGSQHTLPWGRYYRSENLALVSHGTWTTLIDLGLSRIIDLRTPTERALAPTAIPQEFASKIEIIEVPLRGRIKGFDDALEAIGQGDLNTVEDADMAAMYTDLLEHHLQDLRRVISLLEDDSDSVTLFHCTAGKDRTGIVAALLQYRAGISFTDIVEDYALSNLYRTPLRLAQLREYFYSHGIEPRQVRPYLRAPVVALQSAFQWFEAHAPDLLSNRSQP